MLQLQALVNDFSQLFFPHLCAGCGTDILSSRTALCFQCVDSLPLTNFHQYAGNPVEKIYYGRLPLAAAASLCYFTKDSIIQSILHQLKYKGNKEVARMMGRLMGNALLNNLRIAKPDALVPLPLFALRQKQRGYNQAELLCDGMAEVLGVPVLRNAVKRIHQTETQTHKNRIERWQNMEGKFTITNEASLSGRHLVLVDDVITTGATLEACGQELLRAPGSSLTIYTLAYTVK